VRPFKPEHYFDAAAERLREAQLLYKAGDSYALAMYTAGLAAECMLRALKARRDPVFDERHDLLRLMDAVVQVTGGPGTNDEGDPRNRIDQVCRRMSTATNEAYLLWNNDFRFASEKRLRSHLGKDAALRRGIKGDLLKALTLRLIGATQRLIDGGKELWRLL
jgi:hypothetical protein